MLTLWDSSNRTALDITAGECSEIELWLTKDSLEQSVAKRCRSIFLAADGKSNVEIGQKIGLHRNTVDLLRKRFSQLGLDCLNEAHRSGKPPLHSAKIRQKIVMTVCGKPPKGLSRWSCGTLAKKTEAFQNLHSHRFD